MPEKPSRLKQYASDIGEDGPEEDLTTLVRRNAAAFALSIATATFAALAFKLEDTDWPEGAVLFGLFLLLILAVYDFRTLRRIWNEFERFRLRDRERERERNDPRFLPSEIDVSRVVNAYHICDAEGDVASLKTLVYFRPCIDGLGVIRGLSPVTNTGNVEKDLGELQVRECLSPTETRPMKGVHRATTGPDPLDHRYEVHLNSPLSIQREYLKVFEIREGIRGAFRGPWEFFRVHSDPFSETWLVLTGNATYEIGEAWVVVEDKGDAPRFERLSVRREGESDWFVGCRFEPSPRLGRSYTVWWQNRALAPSNWTHDGWRDRSMHDELPQEDCPTAARGAVEDFGQ